MKLLFATDGSIHANSAARLLNRFRCSEPIELTILTSVHLPMNYETMSMQPWYPQWRSEERDRIDNHHRELRGILDRIDGDVHMMQVDEQSAARSILSEAEKSGSDMIIMGARGHSAIGRILLGSVSDHVATHAPCSVLVVRGDSQEEIDDRPIRMTIACDRSSGSHQAVRDIKQFQWNKNASARLVNVVKMTHPFAADHMNAEYALGVEENYKQQETLALKDSKNQIEELAPSIENVDVDVIRGYHVGESILKCAEENQSELIVVGSHDHGLMSDLILGSTSKYVLRHAPCSVWIARSPRVEMNSSETRSESAGAV